MTWQDNHEHENLEVAKSKSIRWVGHVARMEKKKREMRTIFWSESLKKGRHSEDLGVDGRIILELTLGEVGWESCGLHSSGSV